jgi:hypothetical protein
VGYGVIEGVRVGLGTARIGLLVGVLVTTSVGASEMVGVTVDSA